MIAREISGDLVVLDAIGLRSRGRETAGRAGLAWWRTAAVYQCYIRSFADGNGDGVGDIAGLRSRLSYLASLGIDAVWINPWYPSPQHDVGYDVIEYRAIEPAYGDLSEADAVIAEAHSLGLKVILDIVPNHSSSQAPWFQAALAGDEAARARYIFRPGRGSSGELPPNDWASEFGGPAWARTIDELGRPGEWYLHLFGAQQPDFNWDSPDVRRYFEDVLRFWFDRGVDGFRIDVAYGLVKASGLPDAGERGYIQYNEEHPAWDQDGVHEIYRSWRAICDEYEDRVFVAELWVRNNERLAAYLRADELHTAFQFDFLRTPFRADLMREVIDNARLRASEVGAPPTWVLSNHDVVRHVTRYARSQPDHLVESFWDKSRWEDEQADLGRGVRRARAALLLMLALPGIVYLYQGEELGLPEFEDIPQEHRVDPRITQSEGADVGRDGCRIPLPWSGTAPPYGFTETDTATWLPQPVDWSALTVEAQDGDPSSTLELYRHALRLRREQFADAPDLEWIDAPAGILAFRRGSLECWINTTSDPVAMPPGSVLLRSGGEPVDGPVAADEAVWLTTS